MKDNKQTSIVLLIINYIRQQVFTRGPAKEIRPSKQPRVRDQSSTLSQMDCAITVQPHQQVHRVVQGALVQLPRNYCLDCTADCAST